MSFITKRERVFNEYEMGDLPARNECKLKTFASCTDARAWSHFWCDKTDHLVDIIKRNNVKCLPKYIPIKVIVDTLMVAKNSEIARLKLKISQFEQMLAAYENLDLDSSQKSEIAKAHDDIKAATKELDEMCLDLNLSGITEGIGSEVFETGKSRNESIMSRGDDGRSDDSEWQFSSVDVLKEIKNIQIDMPPIIQQFDVSTLIIDPRIDEMQEMIIMKDAKLSAMQNTVAVMENDICEPYCIYAHIYTALEKIFGILCQNDRYRAYLDALVEGKDILNLDITGKIMFKLKVFEKFCLALMSPCIEESTNLPGSNCACYHAKVMTRIETTLAVTAEPEQENTSDAVRSQLVADIMDNSEIKDILNKLSTESKDSMISIKETDELTERQVCCNTCNLEFENLKRLKKLQTNYEELVTCYESVKYEKNCLQVRCNRYLELELELEHLRLQLREYNLLWNEKEHFRKRSEDVDDLKEKYLVLADEATNLEAQLKAENEINKIKSNTIDELRDLNIALEKKLNEISIEFEKEKNELQCRLKETECKLMCSEQQIRSLSGQVDSLLEQDQDAPTQDTKNSIILLNEIENFKEQTMNLKEALYCSEEEKRKIQEEFQEKNDFVNALKSEIEDWKSTCEKTVSRNEHLENHLDNVRADFDTCKEQNKALAADNQEKDTALENLHIIITNKSHEIKQLINEVESKKAENYDLRQQLQDTLQKYSISITALESENKEYSNSLELVKRESKELFEKIKDYKEIVHKKENVVKSLEAQIQENKDIKDLLFDAIEENKRLQKKVEQQNENIDVITQENHRLRDFNDYAVSNINQLQGEKSDYKKSLEIAKKDSEILEEKISHYATLSQQLNGLKEAHDKVMQDKKMLSEQLEKKTADLENALFAMQLNKRESSELLHKVKKSETLEEEIKDLSHSYQKLVAEKHLLQNELIDKNKDLESLLKSLEIMDQDNKNMACQSEKCTTLESELEKLKGVYTKLKQDYTLLQNQFENKTEEINNLYLTLEKRIDENRTLTDQIRSLQYHQKAAQNNIATLEAENINMQLTLEAIKREGSELIEKMKQYEYLETEYDKVRRLRDDIENEKDKIQTEKDKLVVEKEKLLLENDMLKHNIQIEKDKLQTENQILLLENQKIKDKMQMETDKLLIEHVKLKDAYETKLAELQRAYNELEIKKSELQGAYIAQSSDLNRTIKENREMSSQSQTMLNYTEELEKSLIHTRNELINNHDANVSYDDLKKEIEIMKNEKIANQNKIRDLLDKRDDTDNLISSLNEDLFARDDKIAILENHINQLEEEVRQLHHSLDQVVDCSEELRDSSHQSFQESFKQLEAHHSKATHNMKMELAKLKESNVLLEDKLSATLLKVKESQHDQNKYLSQLVELENEREAIVTELKQLEVQSCGDSNLSSINCSSEEILATIDRIRKSLENTVLKVQTSSQLLRSKADEAMKIIEKEKQKIISEKEEAIKDRLELEKQMKDLKENLGNQITHDKSFIKDLEGEIQNQKLIIDKINESTQNYITKLEDEMHALQNLYKNSMEKVSEQQTKLLGLSEEQSYQKDLIDKTNSTLQDKLEEVKRLQEELDKIKSKTYQNTGIQLDIRDISEDTATQTILETKHLKDNAYNWMSSNFDDLITKTDQDTYGDEVIISNVKIDNQPQILTIQKQTKSKDSDKKIESNDQGTSGNKIDIIDFSTPTNKNLNKNDSEKDNSLRSLEEQTLIKNELKVRDSLYTESLHFVKDSYRSYKSKLLSPGPLEQHSISSDEESFEDLYGSQTTRSPYNIVEKKKLNIISVPTISSFDKEEGSEPYSQKLESDSQISNNLNERNSTTDASKDKEMFVIFKDSASSGAQKSYRAVDDNNIKKRPNLGLKDVIVEAVTFQDQTRHQKINDIFSNQNYKRRDSYSPNKLRHTDEKIYQSIKTDAESKPVLEINMPRAEFYSRSGLTSDDEKLSTESYNLNAASNDAELYHDSFQPFVTVTTNTFKVSPDPETGDAASDEETIRRIMKKKNRGYKPDNVLSDMKKYLRDSDDNEGNHHRALNITRQPTARHHKDANELLIRSDDSENSLHESTSATKDSAEQNYINIIPRIIVPLDTNKISEIHFEDKGVLVKLDAPEDYEKKISILTKALEDIEKDSKKKIKAIKSQYDANIKSFINEHNLGVKNMQSLHEETLQDILKIHENEVDNLRSMSIEAMRKADKMEKECVLLKNKFVELSNSSLDQEPVKMPSPKTLLRTKRAKSGNDTKKLTKTNVEAFDVRPKLRAHGPCTCSLDVNISDTVRNIFDQVDTDQRKLAEQTYLRYIVNKVANSCVEELDAQELSFLHFKVCRSWKTKISKEEALQKRIDSLEVEVMNKQRNAQQHMVELDRQVAEERRRLQEVREAVCREPLFTNDDSPARVATGVPATFADKELTCNCEDGSPLVQERRSAGDLRVRACCSARAGTRHKRHKVDSTKAIVTKADNNVEERRERRLQNDELPTRLRRPNDRPSSRRDRQK